MGFRRAFRYLMLRFMRLSAAPEPLARGIACGVTVSFFPVFGIHALMGVGMALLIRANMLAAALGTLLVPPVILPLVFSLDFIVGRKILRWSGLYVKGSEEGFQREAASGFRYMVDHFNELFAPALVGSVVFMLLVWPAAYLCAHKVIAFLAHRRHRRLGKAAIIGIGEDLCDIRRIEKVLAAHGERFLKRCFTPEERAKAAARHGEREPASTLAKRFAAKEACAKALGTGFRRGVTFASIGVTNDPSGKPALALAGGALERLRAITPPGTSARVHVTLGDEYPYAKALVVIEVLDDRGRSRQG